jgi:hypothetical protein
MQLQLLDHEQRIRDLIDPPALRWIRESEEQWRRVADLDRVLQPIRETEAQVQRLLEVTVPSVVIAEIQQLERRRAAAIEAYKRPLADVIHNLTQIDDLVGTYRRINETAIGQIAAWRVASTAAEIAAANVPGIDALGHDIAQRTLNSVVAFSIRDYTAVATGLNAFLAANLAPDSSYTAVPEREFFVSADLVSALTGNVITAQDIGIEPGVVRERIDFYIYGTLDEALTDFAPALLGPLAGAREIALSHNPDRIRHACVSLRTVSMGVLELIAPSEEVRKWSSRPRDFHNGAPRTLTRLRFVAQRIGSPELANFMEHDNQAICRLIEVLHAGTHEIGIELPLPQLRYLFRRIDSFLCALLEATLTD